MKISLIMFSSYQKKELLIKSGSSNRLVDKINSMVGLRTTVLFTKKQNSFQKGTGIFKQITV